MKTEKRLIDANAFRNNLEVDRFGDTNIVKVNIALDKSTVDAVEVVQCKECYKLNTSWCPMDPRRMRLRDFCSYGERRDND